MSGTLSTEKPTEQPQREQDSRALPCSAFLEWWEANHIEIEPAVLSQAFREISERAWNGAMKWAEAECNRIGMKHQKLEGTYPAGKKAGAFECRDIFSQNDKEQE